MNKVWSKIIVSGLLLVSYVSQVQAVGVIVGGSDLLTTSGHIQLETWLGEGSLNLYNVYDKTAGNTASDFHSAADNQGRTFTLLEITNGMDTRVIGGYNPLSWESTGGYNIAYLDPDRTAFLFNLTAETIYREAISNINGAYQGFNNALSGPAFGGGKDLSIDNDLLGGYANIGYSFGDNSQLGSVSYQNEFAGSYDLFTVGAMEVFTIENSNVNPVPVPAAVWLFSSGILGVAGVSRKKRHS